MWYLHQCGALYHNTNPWRATKSQEIQAAILIDYVVPLILSVPVPSTLCLQTLVGHQQHSGRRKFKQRVSCCITDFELEDMI